MTMLHVLAALMPKTPAPVEWSYVGFCQSNGNSLDFGSLSAGSITAGDLAVYVDMVDGENPPSSVVPSGFTEVINTAGLTEPGVRGIVSIKKLAGSEGVVSGMDATASGAQGNKLGLVFRPSREFQTLTTSTPTSVVTHGNPSGITVDPSAETVPVIVLGITGTYVGSATFSVFTPSADAQVAASDGDMRVGYKIYASSPQSTTVDTVGDSFANWLAGFYLKAT